MIECTVWWARPVPEQAPFLELLDPIEKQRWDAYRKESDQRRFLTGRVLAKTVLGAHLGQTPRSVSLDSTCTDCGKAHGPPRLASGPGLSISHSGERIGLAVAESTGIGLDVERAERLVEHSLIDYALNSAERAAIAELDPSASSDAFFAYWTRKEAIMKATGRGLRIPLRSLTVSAPHEPAQLLAATEAALSPAGVRIADLDAGTGYRAAVAVLTDDEIRVHEHWWQPE